MNLGRKLPHLTICVPTLNEYDNLEFLYTKFKEIQALLKKRVTLTLQFTDNASTDGTWQKITELVSKDGTVRAFRFGHNIGFQESILFNFLNSNSDAVVQLDADLQDPIELIPIFVEEWLNGAKIVSGVRISRKENRILQMFRKLGYHLIFKFSHYAIPKDIGDFRLLDNTVINCLRSIKTPSPYLRAIISSYGFPEVTIPYSRDARIHGKSKFRFISVVGLGLHGLLSHSRFAIKIYNFFSAILLIFLGSFISWVVVRTTLGNTVPAGYTSMIIFITLVALLLTLGFSVVTYYVFKIYQIVNGENKFYYDEISKP